MAQCVWDGGTRSGGDCSQLRSIVEEHHRHCQRSQSSDREGRDDRYRQDRCAVPQDLNNAPNTSSVQATKFASAISRSGRFIGTHFFNL